MATAVASSSPRNSSPKRPTSNPNNNSRSRKRSFLDIHPEFLGQYILSKMDPLTLEKWILLFEERNNKRRRKGQSNLPVSAIKKTARSLSSEGSAPSTFSKFRKYSHDLFTSLGNDFPNPLSFFQQPHNDSLRGISTNLFFAFEASSLRLFLFD
ncbi:Phosphodiesterase, partial [Caligus rogercresseyi]